MEVGTIDEIGVEQKAAAIEGKKGLSGGQCGQEDTDLYQRTEEAFGDTK